MALRLRRGTEAERLIITPLQGELIYTTDSKRLYVGDGTTVGGIGLGDLSADTSPALGGDLDLNGNDILGTGNINIDGTITATGSINLGDASEDQINIAGNITSNMIPNQDSVYNIGSPSSRWNNAFLTGLTVDGQIDANAINADLIANDSTLAYDASTGTFVGTLEGNVVGDVVGSVFQDNSTVLVDSVNGYISGTRGTFNRLIFGELAFLDDPGASQVILETVDQSDGAAALYLNSYNSGGGFPSNRATLQLNSTHIDQDYEAFDTWINGRIVFSREDVNGAAAPAVITSRTSRLEMKVHNRYGVDDFPETHGIYILTSNGNVGIGKQAPEAALHNPRDTQLGDIRLFENNITSINSNSNIRLAPNGTGTIELDIPTQSTVGAAGGASAIPANPDIYFKVNINGTEYVVPGFAVS